MVLMLLAMFVVITLVTGMLVELNSLED